MDAKLDFNPFPVFSPVFSPIFLIFTVLNLRFNENNTKTSQKGSQKRKGSFRTGSQIKTGSSSSLPINLSCLGSFIDSYRNRKAETSRTGKNFQNGKELLIYGVMARTNKMNKKKSIIKKSKDVQGQKSNIP